MPWSTIGYSLSMVCFKRALSEMGSSFTVLASSCSQLLPEVMDRRSTCGGPVWHRPHQDEGRPSRRPPSSGTTGSRLTNQINGFGTAVLTSLLVVTTAVPACAFVASGPSRVREPGWVSSCIPPWRSSRLRTPAPGWTPGAQVRRTQQAVLNALRGRSPSRRQTGLP